MTTAPPPTEFVYLVVGYDGSPPASRALDAAVRLLQRVSGHEESQEEITIPAAPINAALSAALAVEAAALRVMNMPFGSSLLALARKRVGA